MNVMCCLVDSHDDDEYHYYGHSLHFFLDSALTLKLFSLSLQIDVRIPIEKGNIIRCILKLTKASNLLCLEIRFK